MEKKWSVKYYRNDEGECPIEDFISTLSEKDKDKIQTFIDFLEQKGVDLKRPQCDYLRDGIHELRVKLSNENVRTLYFFCCETNIILTHSFYKRTTEVPESEINRALIYKEKILQKYNSTTIKEL